MPSPLLRVPFLLSLAALPLAAGPLIGPRLAAALNPTANRRFKIGACDWSIGAQATTGAFDVAKERST